MYTSALRVSVYIHHYSPPLWGIVVYYPCFDTCNNLRTTHTIIFHAFSCATIQFYDFSGFPWPIWTTYNNGNQHLLTVLSSQVWPLQGDCGHTWEKGKHTSVTMTLNVWIRGHWCTIIIISVQRLSNRRGWMGRGSEISHLYTSLYIYFFFSTTGNSWNR